MSAYIVSYDLRNHRDYEPLYKALKGYGTYAKVLESVWVIVSSDKAKDIRDNLANYIDSDDGLFVVRSAGEGAWRKVNCSDKWLKDNL